MNDIYKVIVFPKYFSLSPCLPAAILNRPTNPVRKIEDSKLIYTTAAAPQFDMAAML
jgi:hypothetical protein